ncbi:MAG: hypothetical protein U1A24_10530 [Cypionkella sp.]|uniref:hypothetical protein n=1 Tax=Cypionkella sp. TaxID=2811411 RepID=UPI002AB90F5B|nr:hypothetical protein [Cypionkella sp.]MDZ4310974.1 hypothetical protein [Cypionkella sp.]
MSRFLNAVLLILGIGAVINPLWAEEARQIAFSAPPQDWVEGNFRGYAFATPPNWQEVARSDDGVTLFGGDMETKTGPAFGLMLARNPTQVFNPETTVSLGEAVFAGGLRFEVLKSTETPDGGITVEGGFLISVDPVLGEDHLIILQTVYGQPLPPHRAVLDQILSTLDLPAPGVLPLEPALAGAFAAPVPEGWETGSYMDNEVLIFENRAVQGAFKLMRHTAAYDPGMRSDWYMPDGTLGQPVSFLGQNAVVYEWSKRSKKYHDAADSDETTRLYIFETCLANGDVASVELTGLPSFYTDPQVTGLLDRVELRLGPDAAPCPASALPVGMPAGASLAEPRVNSGLTTHLDHVAAPDTWQSQGIGGAEAAPPHTADAATADSGPLAALDGLIGYLPAEGFVTMTTPDSLTYLAEDGRGYLTIAKGAAVLAPDGFAALVPAGRLGSFEAGFSMEWSAYGWPTTQPEFLDNGAPVGGWHMVHFARSCLAGQIPVAMMFGGISRFTGGNALTQIKNNLVFNWPADIEACSLENAGVGNPATGGLAGSGVAETPTYSPDPTTVDPKRATAPAPKPPAAPPPPPAAEIEPDSFTDQGGGYALYQNARFGTTISYPSAYFNTEQSPENGDGRRFSSADGQSYFLVFGQHDAFGLPQDEMMQQDKTQQAYQGVSYEKSGKNWYVLSGLTGDTIFYRKVILAPDGIIHAFEIHYPAAQKSAFDAVVTHMAQTFGPLAAAKLAPPLVPNPQPAKITTPARNTDLRAALMDAARIPIEADLGMEVIFVVSVLRTDGAWAYLQAKPRNPDGSPIRWSKTRFAAEMEKGVMSDVVMVLLQNTSAGWQVVDHIMGPTDVYWLGWLDAYGLSEALFSE